MNIICEGWGIGPATNRAGNHRVFLDGKELLPSGDAGLPVGVVSVEDQKMIVICLAYKKERVEVRHPKDLPEDQCPACREARLASYKEAHS